MSMIGGKINLGALHHVLMNKKGQDDKMLECIVIPIEKNNLFKGKEGAVYLDIIAFDVKDSKFGDTHLVKQSLSKEVRDNMSEDEQKNQPIIGNLKANIAPKEVSQNATEGGGAIEEGDDLPF